MKKARKEYYTNFIQDNSHDPRKLFRSAKTLFSYKPELNFQGYYDNKQLVNDIGDFFVQKIEVSRTKLDAAASDVSTSDEFNPADFIPLTSCFASFHLVTEENVRTLISKSNKRKSCSQGPMPTQIVVACLDVLLPALTRMINPSLESGCFPESCKHADVHPRLKKPKSEATFPNLRPISNLTFVSKLAERVVFNQTHNHITLNCLYPKAQSSYREFHSTETALLRIKNDILMNMKKQHLTLFVLLDFSATFDTVDHVILLNRLNSNFCISGRVLSWFRSYLYNRSQSVSVNGETSRSFDVKHGVPQGSCLGPLLFILYVSKLFSIVERHLPEVHAYADDTQLYIAFKPEPEHATNAVAAMQACISDIRKWMLMDKLMLNDEKTEFTVIGTRQQLVKVDIDSPCVGHTAILPSSEVRNLGGWFDNQLRMVTQINQTCKAAFFHIFNIRRIRKFLSFDTVQTLVNTFVISRLDYCNSILFGLPNTEL